MRKRKSHICSVLTLAGIPLISMSCTNSPQLPSAEVVLDQDGTGLTVRLAAKDDDGVWKLKDEENDIVVTRSKGGLFDINASITHPDAGRRRIDTRIKATPGQKLLLGGIDNEKIWIEFPRN